MDAVSALNLMKQRLDRARAAFEPYKFRPSSDSTREDLKEALDDVGGVRNVQITRLPKFPQHVGKRLDEAAKLEGLSEVDMYIKIARTMRPA
jgi:hypothetical protein